jgi:hypothetical protein
MTRWLCIGYIGRHDTSIKRNQFIIRWFYFENAFADLNSLSIWMGAKKKMRNFKIYHQKFTIKTLKLSGNQTNDWRYIQVKESLKIEMFIFNCTLCVFSRLWLSSIFQNFVAKDANCWQYNINYIDRWKSSIYVTTKKRAFLK